MPKTLDQKNRAKRQEWHRQWLSEKCTLQHLVDNIVKIEELDPHSDTFNNELSKYKVANEQRLKLLSKTLPDLKNVELANDGGGQLTINLVDYSDKAE